MTLSEIKTDYDKELKKYEDRDDAFRNDYPVYFKYDLFQHEVVDKMSQKDKDAYSEGAGKELYGDLPSMSSVASSSRFCYLSLNKADFKVFNINIADPSKRNFEEKLHVVRGTPPHMDCYIEGDNEIYCFECKCHEQFDDHVIELSESYFSKNRIVTKIDKKYYLGKRKDGRSGHYYNIISPEAFGLSKNPRFDVKQFLTHIMGIQARLEKTKKAKAKLIYFYFIPDRIRQNQEINKVIGQLYKEIETVFNSKIIKDNVKNIVFELYVQYVDKVETANKTNTRRIF